MTASLALARRRHDRPPTSPALRQVASQYGAGPHRGRSGAVTGVGQGDPDEEGDKGTPDLDAAVALGRAILENLGRVLLGTPEALTAAAVVALSGGHLLIEDVPGVGKT